MSPNTKKSKYTQVLYLEDPKTVKYLRTKVPRMGMSEWIRNNNYMAIMKEKNAK